MIGMKFSDSQFVFREPVSPVRLKIVVGGDFCPGEAGAALVRDGRAAHVFAPLAPFLDDADWRLVQFETPLPAAAAPIPKTGPNLIAAPETADILRGRFDVALLANNHVGDHGPQGVLDTIRELQSRGFRTVGAGPDLAAAEAPLELRGCRDAGRRAPAPPPGAPRRRTFGRGFAPSRRRPPRRP